MIVAARPGGLSGFLPDWLIFGNDVSYTSPDELTVRTAEQIRARIEAAEQRAGRPLSDDERAGILEAQGLSPEDAARIEKTIRDGELRRQRARMAWVLGGVAVGVLAFALVFRRS